MFRAAVPPAAQRRWAVHLDGLVAEVSAALSLSGQASTKAFAEWAAAQGKPVLTLAQFDLIENMAEGVRENGIARDLLSEGIAEGVVRADYCRMPAQIRMDFFSPYLGIMDLKSADSLDYFEADAWRYHYPHQVAFYRAILAEVIGIHQPVHFIVVKKKQPFRWPSGASPDVGAFSQLRPSKEDSPMSRYVCVLVRVVVELPEPPAGELAETPRCPFSEMPCHAQPTREPMLPEVSAAMVAFYREQPDAN